MRVKSILKERGMTAKQLAGMINMTEAGLSLALSESGNPKLDTLQKIADVLEVDITELFTAKPDEDFTAMVSNKGEMEQFKSVADLEKYINTLKKSHNND